MGLEQGRLSPVIESHDMGASSPTNRAVVILHRLRYDYGAFVVLHVFHLHMTMGNATVLPGSSPSLLRDLSLAQEGTRRRHIPGGCVRFKHRTTSIPLHSHKGLAQNIGKYVLPLLSHRVESSGL